MTRAEKREIKRKLNKEIADFLKIQKHYFPDLIQDIKKVMDGRHQSYITYEIEVILYVMILKNICSIESMQEMTEDFNEDECVKNIYKILGPDEKEYLPHYVTINACLSRLNTKELEKIRKEMVYHLIRKKSFDSGKFLGTYWLVIVDATQLFCFKERHCLTKTIKKERKKMFPRLPVCLMGDSLYACEPVFGICHKNKWEFLIRYKAGSIPTLAQGYKEIKEMGK